MPVSRLKDVAARAKVSVATASLALSGKGRISAAARERVAEAARHLGYRPARPEQARRGAAAAAAVVHFGDRDYEWNFIRPMIFEFEQALLSRGYSPVLVPVTLKTTAERVREMIESCRCCAVLSIHYANAALFDSLEAAGVRVVLANNSSYQDRFYSVCVDDFQGAYEGTRYLVELGHRSIAFVEYERPDQPGVIADRYVGFRKALEEAKIAFPAERRVSVRFMDEERLAKKLGALFSRPDRPTAVFAHDDYLGMYVIRALAGMGLEVPGHVSLIAPGDVLDYALPVTPPITTLRINTALLGRTAATLLLDRLHNEREDVHVLKVKEQLVKRATCRPA
jgi:LacI family transcriptional regulator